MRHPVLVTVALVIIAGLGLAATAQQVATVTQQRRTFMPREITLVAGETLLFVNDDGELLHHVYTSDPRFSFDTGEQPAGVRSAVRFPVRGTFQVRCEIHPRMLLDVTVR